MFPPYRKSEFEIVYGLGIDKFKEIMMLGNEFEILRKYGKTITYSDTKYQADEFEELLTDNPEFLDSITNDIIAKIKLMEAPEVVETEEEEKVLDEPIEVNNFGGLFGVSNDLVNDDII